MSHPSRVRGLKPAEANMNSGFLRVAPFTGAWIETASASLEHQQGIVAPFTGAWIETGPEA